METLDTCLRDEIAAALGELVSHIEDAFLDMKQRYPLLLTEVERCIKHARAANAYFNNESDWISEEERSPTTNDLVGGETHNLTEAAGNTFQQIHAQEDALSVVVDGVINRLLSIDKVIGRIRRNSIEMERMSLDVMAAMLKAGDSAFSYRAEELTRLCSRTVTLTDRLTNHGEELLRVFHDFRIALAEANSFQKRLFSKLHERLDHSFLAFQEEARHTSSVLSFLSEHSDRIRSPLLAIIDEIKLHEILSLLSVDHLVDSLSMLSTETIDERLDELAVYLRLPELSGSLFDDILQRTNDSLALFQTNIENAQAAIEDMENNRNRLFMRNAGSDVHNAESLSLLFDCLTTVIEESCAELDRLVSMKEPFTERSRNLLEEVSRLEEDFRSFASVIDRFHDFDFTGRASLRHQPVAADEMAAFSNCVKQDIAAALDSIRVFMRTFSSAAARLRKIYEEEAVLVARFIENVRSTYCRLLDEKNMAGQAIAGFYHMTGKLQSLLESTSRDLPAAKELSADIGKVQAELAEVKRHAQREMARLLREKAMESWHIRSQQARAVIDRLINGPKIV